MAKIQFTTPEGTTGEVELTAERMSLGRADDNALIIAHDSVSSHHGEVSIEGNAWVFTDLGSTNGTKIDGERVEKLELAHGGTFTLGHVECVFVGDYEEEQAPAYSAPTRTQTTGGYGSTSVDSSRRTGFGPKTKPKGSGAGALMGLGFLALAACAYAVFSFMQMSA